jgi:hypothetical protein
MKMRRKKKYAAFLSIAGIRMKRFGVVGQHLEAPMYHNHSWAIIESS